jgi:hypothetical protein
VFRAIQKGIADTGAQAYVLADSTYGRYVRRHSFKVKLMKAAAAPTYYHVCIYQPISSFITATPV